MNDFIVGGNVSAVQRKLEKGEVLFRENDPSDACYVVKTGKVVITKAKGNSEIELAALGPGQMFGEMAFFDGQPRSATAKAGQDSTVIALPFSSLNAQFDTFPQWLKAMVKTINDHLREANKRIKNLEQAQKGDAKMFPPHIITRLCAIIALIAHRYGEKVEQAVVVPAGLLRNFTIQVFGEPTHKMQKMMDILCGLQLMKVEDLGEGKTRVSVLNLQLLNDFVDFYNTWLFTDEKKRIKIEKDEIKLLRALAFYGAKTTAKDRGGLPKVNLNQIQNESMKDLGYLVQVSAWNTLTEKGLMTERMQEADGQSAGIKLDEIQRILPFWDIIYAIEANDRSG